MKNKRKIKKRKKSDFTFLKYVLPYSLILGVMIISYRNIWYFDNGSGDLDWKIGKPLVKITNAHNSASLSEIRQRALRLVNRDRELNGVSPLKEDSLLSKAAQLHAEDMLNRGFYSHVTPEGKTPTDRFQTVGGEEGVGENINQWKSKYGVKLTYGLAERNQKSWMYSSGHRENLLHSEYTHFGYGIAVDPIKGEAYAVQKFISK